MNEITTRADALPVNFAESVESDPAITISQLTALLNAAAALERAQRPIVLHSAPQPATTAQAAPAGADVYVPMPPAPPAVQAPQRPSEHNAWPGIFAVSMAAAITSAAAAAATGSEYAVIAAFASASAWCLSVYQIVFNHREA